jgi:nitrile hydratase beta subunit
MDTVHDLGGVQGFGPIPNIGEDDSRLFAEEWKARIWAIAMMSMSKLSKDKTGWTLDWYRHVLERLPPDFYLRADYFEKWILAMMVTAVDEGIAEPAEFVGGRAQSAEFKYSDPVPASEVRQTSPRFKPGDRVVTKLDVDAMHTRLTGYVRGRTGVIDHVIGFQHLPDVSAKGVKQAEQVYVVRFSMKELWPEVSECNDSLLIDMWDSYLEPC